MGKECTGVYNIRCFVKTLYTIIYFVDQQSAANDSTSRLSHILLSHHQANLWIERVLAHWLCRCILEVDLVVDIVAGPLVLGLGQVELATLLLLVGVQVQVGTEVADWAAERGLGDADIDKFVEGPRDGGSAILECTTKGKGCDGVDAVVDVAENGLWGEVVGAELGKRHGDWDWPGR